MNTPSIFSKNKWILGLVSAISVLLVVRYFKNKSEVNLDEVKAENTEDNKIENTTTNTTTNTNTNTNTLPLKSIVIGDSVSILISKNNSVAKILGTSQTEKNLWKSGINLNWLKTAVKKHPITSNVGNVVVSIGANGGYNPKEDVAGLISIINKTFPKAKIYIVKGSWGWGNIKSVTESRVNTYYDKFKKLGATIIPTPIGKTSNPHTNLPVYKIIGKEIDKAIK
jgi:hypothetical protein